MFKKLYVLALCLACTGCVEQRYKNEKPVDTTFQNKEQDAAAKRIAHLNMTVIAASSGINKGYIHAMQILKNEYGANIPSHAFTNKNIIHCADSVQNRLKFMQQAIKSPQSIIWTIQGGFGSGLLLAEMNKWPVPKVKKTLIGFSDVTALALFVSQKWGWRAIHAPVLAHLSEPAFAEEKFATLLDILEGKIQKYDINEVCPLNSIARQRKTVSGRLIGGNLTLVETGIGTCWEMQAKGNILFLEDVNVNSWRIYRSLYHLKESGRLNGAKALVLGDFTKTYASQKEVVDTLKMFANSLNIPVYITNRFGHGKHNMPLIYNAKAVLHDNKMTIHVE
ncbi:MAG: LD-carboxypeptidase [Alphaproteobacteria bacterium]|nr:LD-carboxypeptidase [Alphaproteobacteria bacterium]